MNITFSGVDEKTDLERLKSLLRPGVEIGILLTLTPEGRNRYPSKDWIHNAVRELSPHCAVHVCGRGARGALMGNDPDFSSLFGIGRASRMQINGKISAGEVLDVCEEYSPLNVPIITQHNESNAELVMDIHPNHQLLVDGSGGRGILPTTWTKPQTKKPVGYAGGLGPSTLAAALPQIATLADTNSWIDMEGSLRDESDWFDIDRMEAALLVFDTFYKTR